jgi:hypothetical protein
MRQGLSRDLKPMRTTPKKSALIRSGIALDTFLNPKVTAGSVFYTNWNDPMKKPMIGNLYASLNPATLTRDIEYRFAGTFFKTGFSFLLLQKSQTYMKYKPTIKIIAAIIFRNIVSLAMSSWIIDGIKSVNKKPIIIA